MLRHTAARPLTEVDLPAVRELFARDPVVACLVEARLDAAPGRMRAELWGFDAKPGSLSGTSGSRLDAVCMSGANLVPLFAERPAVRAFADRARRIGRRCSSIVGPAESVLPMWRLLERHWPPAREIRPDQPLMALAHPSPVPPDPLVRRVREDELDILMPACVAMFTEEVGVSPIGADGGASYRARVRELIRAGRAFARIEDDEVVYKAELGAVSARVAQVQGVWVNPKWRGRGYSVAGTSAVVRHTLETVAPTVSLYVNDFNTPAVAAYRRVGFTQVGTFASVLF